uniref:Uncharacterized protein n=1 Tax=Fundulus heteroclitus TaxID=8078 RepID=A0A3Q2QNX3_FUNHE
MSCSNVVDVFEIILLISFFFLLAKQNPAQYLAQHEQLLLDTSPPSPVDSSELLLDVNENGKRRTPDR